MTPGTKSEVIPDQGQGSALQDTWAIRPCFLYKEEYDDCNSFKARFNQYFVHGQSADCTQWRQDYENCIIYEEDSKAVKAGEEIVASEARRRQARLKAHYANDTWKKRSAPPSDWNKPLPEFLVKRNENTFLDIKAKEADEGQPAERTMCCIM